MTYSFSAIFGVSRESANLVGVAVAAHRAGFAVLPVHPVKKQALCTLNDRDRRAADKAEQQAAKEAGRKDWNTRLHHNSGNCGAKHLMSSDAEVKRVFERWLKVHPDLNIGIEVGKSNVIVVDADTAEQVDGFTEWWAEETRTSLLRDGLPESVADAAAESRRSVAPTVRSPGKYDSEKDEWVHKDGGHYYFRLPEGVNFLHAQTGGGVPIPGGAAVYFKDRLILTPPSVRPEGPYVLDSDIHDAPPWLLDTVTMYVEGDVERKRLQKERLESRRAEGSVDDIDVWSAAVSWRELLEPDGWNPSHKFDSCSCEIWTRPGNPGSWKSATAHEPGCMRFEIEGSGWLKFWSTDVPEELRGHSAVSKLQYVALTHFGGDTREAMSHHGIKTLGGGPDPEDEEFLAQFDLVVLPHIPTAEEVTATVHSMVEERVAEYQEKVRDREAPKGLKVEPAGEPAFDIEDLVEDGRVEKVEKPHTIADEDPDLPFADFLIDAKQLHTIPPPKWLVKKWLTRDSLARLSGTPGSWKSFVALDIAACVATGREYHGRRVERGKVLYVAAEGVSGMSLRLKAWEEKNQELSENQLVFLTRAVSVTSLSEWADLVTLSTIKDYDLIILDTQARMTPGLDENSNSDMSKFVARMDDLRQASGACVLAIHHAGHGQGRARGASSVWGGMDTELLLTRDKSKGEAVLSFLKSKDSEELSGLTFTAEEHHFGEDEDGDPIGSLTLTGVVREPDAAADDLVESDSERSDDYFVEFLLNQGASPKAGRGSIETVLRGCGFKLKTARLEQIARAWKAANKHGE